MKTCLLFLLIVWPVWAISAETVPAGSARIDVTPEGPVQLINVKEPTESDRVVRRLYARALAIGEGGEVVVLMSFDGIGVPGSLAERVAARLHMNHQLARERIAICATHTHWAPHLTDMLPNIYGGALPAEQQERVDAYTEFLAHQLESVAKQALANRQPSHLAWATGRATFAANRRMEEGGQFIRDLEKGLMITWNPNAPMDHDLPVFTVRDAASGKLTAIHFTYACHNVALTGTTISGFENAIHSDWVGLAQEEIERRHPDCVAVGTIGCGGDQRPDFCGNESVALAHAKEISDEVDRLLRIEAWKPFGAPKSAVMDDLELPLTPLPPVEKLREFAENRLPSPSIVARASVAKTRLAELESGKEAPSGVPFRIQSWSFSGEGPVLVFMSGEVCVDYQLRLKRERGDHVWPIAYANATPCYIVSKRMLEKGGYEAGNSMFYYGWLRPLDPSVEEVVMEALGGLIDKRDQ